MLDKDTVYNAEYKDLDDLVYFTAIQVAEMVGEPVTTIYSWVKDDCFGDLLKLNKVNGRRVFTKHDIENIRYIKELRNKNYSIQQTRDYISKQGFKFGEYDGGLIDPKDPLGFEALAIKLTQKQNEELQAFKKDIITEMSKYMYAMREDDRKYLQGISDELSLSLESKISKIEKLSIDVIDEGKKNLNDISKELETRINNSNERYSDDIKEYNKLTTETLNDMKKQLEDIKQIAYVNSEEIKKQKQEPPNKWFKRFMGWK